MEYLHLRAEPGAPKCDFCSEPVGEWCYVAGDVAMTMKGQGKQLVMSSDAHWGACDLCAALVDAGDVQGLFQRSLRLAPKDMRDEEGNVRTVSQGLLQMIQGEMFWEQFTGRSHRAREHPEHPDYVKGTVTSIPTKKEKPA